MTTITVDEAKVRFAELLEQVRSGGEFVLTEDGRPVARLAAAEDAAFAIAPVAPRPRVPGQDAGKVWVSPDFNAPLPDDVLDAFEGR